MPKRKETVTRVVDGDTIRTAARPKTPIRLANVNAPERNARGGKQATAHLKSILRGGKVTVDVKARDKYRRVVAEVKVGRKSVNRAMNKKLKK